MTTHKHTQQTDTHTHVINKKRARLSCMCGRAKRTELDLGEAGGGGCNTAISHRRGTRRGCCHPSCCHPSTRPSLHQNAFFTGRLYRSYGMEMRCSTTRRHISELCQCRHLSWAIPFSSRLTGDRRSWEIYQLEVCRGKNIYIHIHIHTPTCWSLYQFGHRPTVV